MIREIIVSHHEVECMKLVWEGKALSNWQVLKNCDFCACSNFFKNLFRLELVFISSAFDFRTPPEHNFSFELRTQSILSKLSAMDFLWIGVIQTVS